MLKKGLKLIICNKIVTDFIFWNLDLARPIEFDRRRALNQALKLFWRKGYQGCSLIDLLNEMGIGRSSFYAAFTDKRSLFLECLGLFLTQTTVLLHEAASEVGHLRALRFFFENRLSGMRHEKAYWGCMLVNTVTEMADVDDELSAVAGAHLDRLCSIFASFIEAEGASPDLAEELADLLTNLNAGARVSIRLRPPEAEYLRPINTAFQLIEQRLQ